MRAIVSSRLLLLGDFSPAKKILNTYTTRFPLNSMCFVRHRVGRSAPLTLESIGIEDESDDKTGDPNESKKRVSKIGIKSAKAGSDTMHKKNMVDDTQKRKADGMLRTKIKRTGVTDQFESDAKDKVNKNPFSVDRERILSFKEMKIIKKRMKRNSMEPEKNPFDIEDAPFASKSFSELGLPRLLIDRLESERCRVPTEVQASAIPIISSRRDVVIQSYTGSGKTLAYVIPILSELDIFKTTSPGQEGNEPNSKIGKGGRRLIEAVVVAPSRELAMQIVREFEKLLGPDHRTRVQQLVGGANLKRQQKGLLKNHPSIIVGTPGRIAEVSKSGKIHTHKTRFLVLDEIDELLAPHFRTELHRIVGHVGETLITRPDGPDDPIMDGMRQTIMVSATVPFSVVRAGQTWAWNPLLVRADTVGPLDSIIPKPIDAPTAPNPNTGLTFHSPAAAAECLPPTIEHYYCVSIFHHRIECLRKCVHALDARSVIAFLNHVRPLKDVAAKLRSRGLHAVEMHGDIGKLMRLETIRLFKRGEIRILVTNELCARGLDVPQCDLIVNLDLPTDSMHYSHRAGRTGRLGRKGKVVSIVQQQNVNVLKKLQKQLGVPFIACDFGEGKMNIYEDESFPSGIKEPKHHREQKRKIF